MVLGGLIISAIGFIVVANSAISTFAGVQKGQKPDGVWGHCGGGGDSAGCGDLAADQIGFHHSVRNTPMQTIHFYPIALMWSRPCSGFTTPELGLAALSGA